jgi:hypothetical protein
MGKTFGSKPFEQIIRNKSGKKFGSKTCETKLFDKKFMNKMFGNQNIFYKKL